MKHTRITARLALCAVGMILLTSCASNDAAPLADSSKLPAGPTLPPAEQAGATTTVVAWDPSQENAATSPTQTLPPVTPEEEAAMVAPIKQFFDLSFRKEAPELVLQNIERSAELIAAVKAGPSDPELKREPGMAMPAKLDISIESMTRFTDTSCVEVSAQPSCVGVRFFLVLDGKPYSRELVAHVYPKDGNWVWTVFSFCKLLYSIGGKCPIDVPQAPYELNIPAGGPDLTTTTVING